MSETITRFIPAGDQTIQFLGPAKMGFSRSVLAEIIGRGQWDGDVIIMPCELTQIDIRDGMAILTVQRHTKEIQTDEAEPPAEAATTLP